jgi:hypothetical protein
LENSANYQYQKIYSDRKTHKYNMRTGNTFHSMNPSLYWVDKHSFLSLLDCLIARFSSSMTDFSTIIKKIYWNRKFHSYYMRIIRSTIFLKPIVHLWRNLSSFENTLITSLTSQGFIWNFFHSSFYLIDKRHQYQWWVMTPSNAL